MRFCRALFGASVFASIVALFGTAAASAGEVTVYSNREAAFIEPLLRVFEGLTGTTVNFVATGPDLVGRLREEGAASKADLLIASDFAQLIKAKQLDLTRASSLDALEERVPDVYRDVGGHWFALTRRARVIVVSTRRPKGEDPATYEDLTAAAWKGKVCVRSGLHPYNVGLVASIFAQNGEAAAEAWLKGIKQNLARKPEGGDRDQIVAVHNGICDAAIVNTYYIAELLKSEKPELKAAARSVRVVMPNSQDRGTHVAISGMALAHSARHVAEAELLMDFLTSRPAQKIFALNTEEYPIREDERPSQALMDFGPLEAENVSLMSLALLFPAATALIEKVGFDKGPGG